MSALPYLHYPKLLKLALISHATTWLNMFPPGSTCFHIRTASWLYLVPGPSSLATRLFVLQKRVCGGKEDTIRMRSDDQIGTINAYLRKRTLVKCVLYGIVS